MKKEKPTSKTADRNTLEAAKRSNKSPYCIDNVRYSDTDVAKFISHRKFDHFFILCPHSKETDFDAMSQWDGPEQISSVKGASWNNQIRVWTVTSHEDGSFTFGTFNPTSKKTLVWSDLTESNQPESFTHFGMYVGTYDKNLDDWNLYVAFREYYTEMEQDQPVLRAIPSSKLLVNIEAKTDKIYKCVFTKLNRALLNEIFVSTHFRNSCSCRIREALLNLFHRKYHDQILANFPKPIVDTENGLSGAQKQVNAFKLVKYFNRIFKKRDSAERKKEQMGCQQKRELPEEAEKQDDGKKRKK